MKILVVYNPKTKKIFPHRIAEDGTVVVTVSGGPNVEDSLLVSSVDIKYIDTLNWYVLDESNKERANL